MRIHSKITKHAKARSPMTRVEMCSERVSCPINTGDHTRKIRRARIKTKRETGKRKTPRSVVD